MSATVIASRYAKAFITSAGKDAAKNADALAVFCDMVSQNQELVRLFSNVTIPAPKKAAVIRELAKKIKTPAKAVRFLEVLAENERLNLLSDVKHAVFKQLDAMAGVQRVSLVVASAPTKAKLASFEKAFKQRLGMDIRLDVTEDPALLAGGIALVGSTVYDGSLRGRLQRLRKDLVKENA
ncbi:MAG: ATP synthase F1 subunit delta [Acidobacteria bacterium]|nr:ATP synthase F1 subunit delta [Acidobacteriota bacterium]